MNQASVVGQYQSNRGVLLNNIVVTPGGANAFLAGSGVTPTEVSTIWTAGGNTMTEGAISDNSFSTLGINTNIVYGPGMVATAYPTNPTFEVTAGSLLTGAEFTNAKFSEANRTGFFQNVAYRGAFGSTDWTAGWAEFKPVDKAY